MMGTEKFIIDSNSFIEPFESYYAFDFNSNFWNELEKNIKQGNIFVIDYVFNEIKKGEDDLSHWLSKANIKPLSTNDTEIIKCYARINQHLSNRKLYSELAHESWAISGIADPWVIVTAMAKDLTIITFEKKASFPTNQIINKLKIPNIASYFDVNVQNLYYMMRSLGIKLSNFKTLT